MKDVLPIALMLTERADLGMNVRTEYVVGLPIVRSEVGRFGGLIAVSFLFFAVCVLAFYIADLTLGIR
jgi:hypothetical protein